MTGAPPAIPDYELLRIVGRGAYGEVWLARSVTGIFRALKVVYRSNFEEVRPYDREFAGIRRFESISRAQSNQVDVLHVGRNDSAGFFYYVMELADDANSDGPMPGTGNKTEIAGYQPRTLKEDLARRSRLPARECRTIAIALCDALDHLHSHRLIHRDIKPSNIIFIGGVPKLADLGLVSTMDSTRSFVGTEGYVPREGPGTVAADLYSLGKVLYEMVTGRPRGDFPLLPADIELLDDRPELLELNEVVVRACAEDAGARYRNAAEFRSDLLLLQAGKSVRRLHAVERRLRRLAPIAAGLCVLAGGVVAVQYLQNRHASERARVALEFRERAETQELATRQLLYSADMNLVQQALTAGDLGRARLLLDSHLPQPDGPDLRGFEWSYFRQQCEGEQIRVLSGHSNVVESVAFSPDGRNLATASYDGTLKIWEVATGRCETLVRYHGRIESVGYSPDGRWVVVVDRLGACEVRDAVGGEVVFRAAGKVTHATWSPTGHRLAIASEEPAEEPADSGGGERGGVSLWNLTTGVREFDLPGASLLAIFSRDGKRLVTRGSVRTFKVWDVDSRRELASLGDCGPRSTAAFTPDGRHLVIGDETGRLRLHEADTGRVLRELVAHDGSIWKVDCSPDGRHIATASTDQTVRLFEAGTLKETAVFRGHIGEVWSVAFSPDGLLLASGSKDGTARLWNVNPHRESDVLTRQAQFWNWPVFSDSGEFLAVGEGIDVTVRRVMDGGASATLARAFRPLGFLRGDQELLTLGATGEIQSWNWRSRVDQPAETIPAGLTKVRAHVVLPSSTILAVGDDEGMIRLWDLVHRRALRSWEAHPARIVSLAVSPDGLTLASGSSEDPVVNLWNVADGTLKSALSGHTMGIYGVVFSPDGAVLASASPDDTCRIWDAVHGRALAALTAHKGGAYHPAFSGDGRTLAVGTGDRKVRLWNLPTFRDLGTIDVEPVTVFFAGFVPRQRVLATVSYDFARTNCSLRLLRAPGFR